MDNIKKLERKAFGVALGLTWGATCFIMALLDMYFSVGSSFVRLVGEIYPGYDSTIEGAIIGLVFGFFDFFIFGYILAHIYNVFSASES